MIGIFVYIKKIVIKDIDKAFHYLRLDPISFNESNMKKKNKKKKKKKIVVQSKKSNYNIFRNSQTIIDNVAF